MRPLDPTEQIDMHANWYPWCQWCRAAGWTAEAVLLTSQGDYLCVDCADDDLAVFAAAAA